MEEKRSCGLGVASLVLGILAFCFSAIPFINVLSLIMGFLAFIFGIIGIAKNNGRGMAIGGLVTGILALMISVNSFMAVSDTLDTISDITGVSNPNSTKSSENIQISREDIIKGKDVEVKIDNIGFNQRVDPPVKDMFYEYYQVKDSDNTYLYLVLDCKNISTINLSASSIADVTVKYNNAYTYSSFSAIPDRTLGFTYTSLTNIKPLTSQKIYYLAEMPKNIADETDTPVEISIKVDNKTYKYQYR